jgi:hypothetical protein
LTYPGPRDGIIYGSSVTQGKRKSNCAHSIQYSIHSLLLQSVSIPCYSHAAAQTCSPRSVFTWRQCGVISQSFLIADSTILVLSMCLDIGKHLKAAVVKDDRRTRMKARTLAHLDIARGVPSLLTQRIVLLFYLCSFFSLGSRIRILYRPSEPFPQSCQSVPSSSLRIFS